MQCPRCGLENPNTAIRCDCEYQFRGGGADHESTRQCPYCAEKINAAAIKCRYCGESLVGRRLGTAVALAAVAGVMLVLVIFSVVRVYYGGSLGLKIVAKASPSFTDTIVNLDDIMGQPRIVVSSQHPAIKRQLEEMGLIETDEQAEKKARAKFQEEYERQLKKTKEDVERETERLRRQLGY